jgi:DNA polymerase-3 subunit gamma/tau
VVEPSAKEEVIQPEEPKSPLTLELLQGSWAEIVETIGEKKRAVWTALVDTVVVSLAEDVVTIGFPSLSNAEVLKKPQGSGLPVNAELVREAILAVTGHRVRFKVQEIAPASTDEEPGVETVAEPAAEPATQTASWPTVVPPGASDAQVESEPEVESEVREAAPEAVHDVAETPTSQLSQVGEAVIREVLGGELISEHRVDDQGDR